MTVESRHGSLLRAKIAQRRSDLLEGLAKRLSHEVYMTVCGTIQGLDDALALSEAADQELYGGDPDDGAEREED